jgi:hypothetical protein
MPAYASENRSFIARSPDTSIVAFLARLRSFSGARTNWRDTLAQEGPALNDGLGEFGCVIIERHPVKRFNANPEEC